MALTQLPAVEPSCGGFCGELPRSALFATVFSSIITRSYEKMLNEFLLFTDL
jgi:hypothetical protein